MAEKSNLNIEERFAQLQKANQRPQTPRPKIQKVAHYLRDRKHFAKHYSPKFVSIGPIHHGLTNLQLGEQYKLMWAATYIESTGLTPQTLHKKISDNIAELKDLFMDKLLSNYETQGFEEKLSWMLFVDGCSLLHILEKARLDQASIPSIEAAMERIILHDPHPKAECKEANEENQKNSDMVTYRNIQELKASGIRLKSSKTRRPGDISFSHGWLAAELTLPEIVVDDTTATSYLNLMAYEMCSDFENDYGICSFVAFLDSLIDHPEDVKALRSEGILLNSLGSDEEVAKLFNIISSDLVPDTLRYSCVRAQINMHYRNKYKTWIAQGCHTYFSNPWAIIAFHAAVLALALTFIQTWFAIYPVK
ncbi:hypothetical protein SESBI_30742 [Sesbania bispinosa]|nr:hypothetical protein SESBI_30742 [Sesbania bispinosa]